ncbi:hypothetical protein [Oligosphaera ethanolica]|uniref:Uncharacterized protein n=1 Tax=Oligosphaera ethanolica TaxID=760260 RepID=A0AAE3VEZ0_9BACT|nr:hypothetical protein [Oligosphaera ethanolica]MDQ0289071.1 hypothetical protein [Oligosphaera ethanolica]
MKEILITIWFLVLAIIVILLKAMAWLFLAPIHLFIRWGEMIRYEAQCLRHPPPPGGRFGAMGRSLREQKQGKSSQEVHHENK